MSIALHLNRPERLRLHEISGRTTAREFSMLLGYYWAHPDIANTDAFTFIDADAELEVSPEDMRGLRQDLCALQRIVKPPVILRSAWICSNIRAWPVLEAWLSDRHTLDGTATEAILVPDLETAEALFERDEIALVDRRSRFELLARFDAEPASP